MLRYRVTICRLSVQSSAYLVERFPHRTSRLGDIVLDVSHKLPCDFKWLIGGLHKNFNSFCFVFWRRCFWFRRSTVASCRPSFLISVNWIIWYRSCWFDRDVVFLEYIKYHLIGYIVFPFTTKSFKTWLTTNPVDSTSFVAFRTVFSIIFAWVSSEPSFDSHVFTYLAFFLVVAVFVWRGVPISSSYWCRLWYRYSILDPTLPDGYRVGSFHQSLARYGVLFWLYDYGSLLSTLDFVFSDVYRLSK